MADVSNGKGKILQQLFRHVQRRHAMHMATKADCVTHAVVVVVNAECWHAWHILSCKTVYLDCAHLALWYHQHQRRCLQKSMACCHSGLLFNQCLSHVMSRPPDLIVKMFVGLIAS